MADSREKTTIEILEFIQKMLEEEGVLIFTAGSSSFQRDFSTDKAYVVTLHCVSPSSLKTSKQEDGHFLVLDMKKMVRKFVRQTRWTLELDRGDHDARTC